MAARGRAGLGAEVGGSLADTARRRRAELAAVTLVALGTLVASSVSARPAWLDRPHLTGDWGGHRTSAADRGIEPGARYTSGFWSNLSGGFETGTTYEGFAEWWLDLDLEALAGWKGGGFHIGWYSYHGGQPSEDLVGLFPTQDLSGHEAEVAVRFYEILLRQTWSEERLVLEVGQLAADTDFFVSDYSTTLLNAGFGFLGLGRFLQIAPFYPLAAPGVYFQALTPSERWELRVGVYTADPGNDESSNFGFGWSFDNGVVGLAELRVHGGAWGRRGDLAVGVLATNATVDHYQTGDTITGAYGLFGMIDQLLIERTATRPGLGLFVRGYGVPQSERSQINWYVDGGLELTRPFAGRDEDVVSLGVTHLRLASDYVAAQASAGEPVEVSQTIVELTYRFQATGWLTLQPDLQLVFDPAFSGQDATVIGLRAVVDF